MPFENIHDEGFPRICCSSAGKPHERNTRMFSYCMAYLQGNESVISSDVKTPTVAWLTRVGIVFITSNKVYFLPFKWQMLRTWNSLGLLANSQTLFIHISEIIIQAEENTFEEPIKLFLEKKTLAVKFWLPHKWDFILLSEINLASWLSRKVGEKRQLGQSWIFFLTSVPLCSVGLHMSRCVLQPNSTALKCIFLCLVH